MRVILVDDEPLALDLLEILIKKVKEIDIEVVGKYTDTQLAFESLKQLDVDAVFLDMEMGEVHGLEFAEELLTAFPQVEVVFVTAYPQYALEAFEVNAMDYLLKPVNIERLKKSLIKLQEKQSLYSKNKELLSTVDHDLFITSMGSFNLIDSQQNRVKWRTKKVKELFVYLWHHQDRPVHKTRIMEELWPEAPASSSATLMHTTIYQIRKTMKEIGIENPITLTNEQYVLNVDVRNDLDELKQMVMSSELTRSTVHKVVQLYVGDYLEEENYDWSLYDQQRIKQIVMKYFERYVMREKDNVDCYDLVEALLKKLIQLDLYNEKYIYLLLNHYGKTKKTQKMIILFDSYKKRLLEELHVDVPMEIMELYESHLEH